MDDTTTTLPAERAGPAPIVRIGLLGAAAAALVAVAILAAGAGASPAGTLAAGTTSTSTTGSLPGVVEFDHRGGPGGPGGMRVGGGVSITAISGNRLSLATVDGWTRTITVDSGTTYTEGDATIALSDLAVGDEIRFEQTLEADGTWSIDAIAVIPPHAGGQVTAISGSSITVTHRDGTSATITVNGSTTYRVNGTDGKALADITVGMVLMAEGTENADGSLTATTVRAGDPGTFLGHGHGHGPGHGPGAPDDDSGLTPDATTAPAATSDSAG